MKFNSQICTTVEQSQRLFSLGLKKETADMCWIPFDNGTCVLGLSNEIRLDIIPAWSLHRLIEMMPSPIKIDKLDLPTFHHYAYLGLSQVSVDYHWRDYDFEEKDLVEFYGNGFFAAVVDAIEWLIKEGYF